MRTINLMRTIGLLLSFVFILLSCSKEDIQPKGTFQTFRQKIKGTWKLTESTTNGNPDNLAGFEVEITFEENSNYYQVATIDIGGTIITHNDSGNWFLTDNRSTLVISSNSIGTMSGTTITKLTSSELILTDTSSGDTTVSTYDKL